MRRYIDVNCFLGSASIPLIKSFTSAEELIKEMDDIGIEKAFVSHFNAQEDFMNGNLELMKAIEKHGRLFPCWIVNPDVFYEKKLYQKVISEIKAAGVHMVRMQPGPFNGYSLHRWAMCDFVEGLLENNVILLVDFVIEKGLSHRAVPEYEWEILYQFATFYSKLSIILSGRKLSVSSFQVLGLLRSCRNIMLDISSFQKWRSTEVICSEVGAGQLVFGSSMPYFNAAQFVIQVEKASIPETDKQKIASENIISILQNRG